MRVSLFKRDRPRPIDRYIDFFGGAASIVAGLAVAGCAGLTPLSGQGGLVTRGAAASVVDGASSRAGGSAAAVFTDSARDQVFSLAWKAEDEGDRVRIDGLLENREGPEVADVTLQIVLWTSGETPLTQQRVTLAGVLAPKNSRPFVVSVPTPAPPSRVSVEVHAYLFPNHGGRNAVEPDALGPASRINNGPAKETIQ
jgi:hypothetical protein